MADSPFGAVRVSVREAQAALAAMDKRVDLATAAATKKASGRVVTSIKAQMRGRPRWDRRGRSSRTGEEVNLNLNPHHVTKGGGPGKLTGSLSRSIRKSRKPRKTAEGYSVAVLAGGAGGPQNLYKGKVEATQPYFKPGVNKAVPKLPAVWEAAWAKATQTKK
jgi:hypothetical protein